MGVQWTRSSERAKFLTANQGRKVAAILIGCKTSYQPSLEFIAVPILYSKTRQSETISPPADNFLRNCTSVLEPRATDNICCQIIELPERIGKALHRTPQT